MRSAEFLGESEEKSFRRADIAEPIRVFVLDYFAYELRGRTACPPVANGSSSRNCARGVVAVGYIGHVYPGESRAGNGPDEMFGFHPSYPTFDISGSGD
jgi:hypothetical protein